MLKSIVFLAELAVLVLASIWAARQEGEAQLSWVLSGDHYTLNMKVGYFVAAIFIALAVMLVLQKIILGIFYWVRGKKLRAETRRSHKAQIMTIRSLSAIASGDEKAARKYAGKVRKLQGNCHGFSDLLDGMTARMRGAEENAARHFTRLAKNKDAAFLGMRGLLQIEGGNGEKLDETVLLAEDVYNKHPNQPWVVKTLYGLYIQAERWADAEDLIKKSVRLKIMDKRKALKDRIALMCARARDYKARGFSDDAYAVRLAAYRLDKDSLVCALELLDSYLEKNKKRASVKLIERNWKRVAHPQMLEAWSNCAPQKKRVAWYERLLALNTNSAEGQLALAEATLNEKMYGQARSYLEMAASIGPSKKLYQLYARLEIEQNSDHDAAKNWLEMALEAPENKAWFCVQTGLIYDRWEPLAAPHNSFNTVIWDMPLRRAGDSAQFLEASSGQSDQPSALLFAEGGM